MLELLAEYAHDHGLEIEPGFKPKDIRWAVVCDSGGRILDVLELGDAAQKYNRGQTFSKCPETDRGALQAGGKCHFLVETAAVIALYGEDANTGKTLDKHRYFISLLGEAGEVMPELKRLAVMLDDPVALGEIQLRLESQNAKPTDRMTFRVGNSFLLDSTEWHEWWRTFRKTLAPERGATKEAREVGDSKTMRCLVSGELIEPAPTHSKIEGLAGVGGQPSGDALICFDKEAFRSYGLEQSSNAAVSEEAMSTYRAALNDLIGHHSQRVAGTQVVHWFKSQVSVEDDPLAWLQVGGEEQERNAQHLARQLLKSIRTGERPSLAGNSYYVMTLSGAAGRIMVRDFIEGPFEELVANILAWFEDLEIVHRDGGRTAPDPKFMDVLGATVRAPKDVPPQRVAAMWRIAACSEPISADVLAQAVFRTKTDIVTGAVFNHARFGLLKAYHIRKARRTGGNAMPNELMPYRNEQHPSPAYQCGRLMAVLARLQQAALGDVGAGVVQRYYAAAGTTPALVFGRLTRLSQFHLARLDAGLAHWYESRIAAIWGRLEDALPAALSLEEQSLFALGYYQELAEMRTKRAKEESDE